MADTETTVYEIHIRGTIDAVWHEITKTDELQECFFNMHMDTDRLEPGGQIRMRSASKKYTGVVGEVLEFDAPNRFSHTFKFTQYDDSPCTVTYDLVQVEDGVEFTMTCDGIPAASRTARQMKQGGPMIIKVLKAVVETGKIPFGIRVMYGFFKLLDPLTPKVSRSENWPIDRSA
jgi:uncharacterized protein YndB with AHSA1/START domain